MWICTSNVNIIFNEWYFECTCTTSTIPVQYQYKYQHQDGSDVVTDKNRRQTRGGGRRIKLKKDDKEAAVR